MEARGSAGSTAPRIGGAWDRGSALQTARTPETAPPKPVVFEVIALVMVRVTATLSKGKDRSCKQAFGDKTGATLGFRRLNAQKSVTPRQNHRAARNCTASSKTVQCAKECN
jgi:hypothetical protein